MQLSSQLQRNYDGWLLFFSVLVTAFLILIYDSLTTHHADAYSHLNVEYQAQDESSAFFRDIVDTKGNWQRIAEPVNLGMRDDPYWFRLMLPPTPRGKGSYLLDINYPLLDAVDVYFYDPVKHTLVKQNRGGDAYIYNERTITVPSLVFEVPES